MIMDPYTPVRAKNLIRKITPFPLPPSCKTDARTRRPKLDVNPPRPPLADSDHSHEGSRTHIGHMGVSENRGP